MKIAKKRGRKPGIKVGPYKVKALAVGDTITFDNPATAHPGEYPNTIPAKSFNDCIFEITNSMMDQNTKAMAFAAMAEAAKVRMN